MGSCWLSITLLAQLIQLLPHATEAAKLSLDTSDIKGIENQQRLFVYNILSHLDHLATHTSRLKLSPKAKEQFKFLENKTNIGLSFQGLTHVPDQLNVSKEAFDNISSGLSPESLLLLKALSQKGLDIPLVLKPSDEDLPEVFRFMDAFKQYWKSVDKVAAMEIDSLDVSSTPSNIREIIANRTKKYEQVSNREARSFVVPSLPFQVSKEHLKSLLEDVFTNPRNHATSEIEKHIIKMFITMKFEELGLTVYNHDFSAHETHYLFGHVVEGTNVVGIMPGTRWGTPEDTPLIIGAHYDTVPETAGVIDNASGTAAIIEAARMIATSKCAFKNSIFFVAFDLEEIGTQGSFMFVKDILMKLIFPTYGITAIGGAIILDCVANFDSAAGTQEVPSAWEEKVHGLKSKLEKQNNTGDFLAVMYRENPDSMLAEKLTSFYHGLGDSQYRLEKMALQDLEEDRPNDTVNVENFDFFRSDHYRFWYPSDELPNVSFPAILLTDTGPYRGKMKTCYHSACDTMEIVQPNIDFLAKITLAATWVVADLALASCGPRGLFKVPDMFQVTKERTTLFQDGNEFDNMPVVTLARVIEILKNLASTDPSNLETSLTIMREKFPKSSPLKNLPIHRFDFASSNRNGRIIPGRKLLISLHDGNSTFLIPLKMASQNTAPEFIGNNTESDSSKPVTSIDHSITLTGREKFEKSVSTLLKVN